MPIFILIKKGSWKIFYERRAHESVDDADYILGYISKIYSNQNSEGKGLNTSP